MRKKIVLAVMVLIGTMFLVDMSSTVAEAVEIHWDGYCDGMNVNFSGLVIYGTRTGCSAGIKMIGDIGLGPNNQIALTLSTLNSGDPSLVETFYVYLNNRTWELWISYGTSVSLFNSGTWSIGPPDAGEAVSATDQ